MTDSDAENAASDALVIVSAIPGEIVDTTPFTSEAEAQRFLNNALAQLKLALVSRSEAEILLAEAERRGAWKVMGFESWDDCLTTSVADYFELTVPQAKRLNLAAQLREAGRTTLEIAQITKSSRATVHRDLDRAREAGLLGNEPERLMAADGRQRPVRRPRDQSAATRRQRPDFVKSFRTQMSGLERVTRELDQLRKDNRYQEHLSTLTDLHQALLSDVLQILSDLQDDLMTVSQDGE